MADFKVLFQAISRPWFIDPVAAKKYASVIASMFARNGSDAWAETFSKPAPENFVQMISAAGKKMGPLAPGNPGSVALINLQGAVMKYDHCGAPGSLSIMEMIDQANAMPNIDAIVLQIDSPGGAVDGTQQLGNKIKSSAKPVVAFIQGQMCSAAMWFGSSAAYRIASSNTDFIGSIGTMCAWEDYSGLDAARGIRSHEVYATASTEKNAEFLAASGADPNYQPLIENVLDPINEEFISTIKANLPGVNEAVFSGKNFIATKALEMGLIDKIGTLSEAVNHALGLAAKTKKPMATQKTFTHVQALVGLETLEQLNEGIWLTEAHVDAIDQALATANTAIQQTETLQQSIADLQAINDGLVTNAEADVNALATANARIIELEALPIIGANPVNEGDPATGANPRAKYRTSADDEADKIRKQLKKK